MRSLKDLMTSLGSPNTDCRQDGAGLDGSVRAGYLFNTTIAGIEDADACLIIGANPRREAPVITARIRKRYLMGGFKAGLIGEAVDLTYAYDALGGGGETLSHVLYPVVGKTRTQVHDCRIVSSLIGGLGKNCIYVVVRIGAHVQMSDSKISGFDFRVVH